MMEGERKERKQQRTQGRRTGGKKSEEKYKEENGGGAARVRKGRSRPAEAPGGARGRCGGGRGLLHSLSPSLGVWAQAAPAERKRMF